MPPRRADPFSLRDSPGAAFVVLKGYIMDFLVRLPGGITKMLQGGVGQACSRGIFLNLCKGNVMGFRGRFRLLKNLFDL